MKKTITLLSLMAITTGCVKIPASWVDNGNTNQRQQISSQQYIDNQNGNTQGNNVQQTSQQQDNKWATPNDDLQSAYGTNKKRAQNQQFNLNNLQATSTAKQTVQCEPQKKLSDAKVQKVQQVSSFENEKQSGKVTKNGVQMIYKPDNIRRVPMGQYINAKVYIATKDILNKDVNYLVNKFGVPSKSQQQNSFYIWQYMTKADGFECTLDLTIKNNRVRHVALLGPVSKKTQAKCIANIVRYNMELNN